MLFVITTLNITVECFSDGLKTSTINNIITKYELVAGLTYNRQEVSTLQLSSSHSVHLKLLQQDAFATECNHAFPPTW